MKKRLSHIFRLALCSFAAFGSFMAIRAVSTNREVTQTEAVATRYKYIDFATASMTPIDGYDWGNTATARNTDDDFRIAFNYFSNNAGTWKYLKCGTNSGARLASLITKATIDKAITEIRITVDAIDYPQYINGQKLYVASNDKFTNNVQTKSFSVSVGVNTIAVPSPVADMYYKLEWDCQQSPSSSQKGFIQISKVEYYYDYVVNVTNVSLSRSSASVYMNENFTLTASVYPSNATNKSVSWSSSNTNIATVDSNGKVTGVNEGTATITATTVDGGKTASCTVTVLKRDVTGVSLDKHELLLYPNETYRLTATITPSNASIRTVNWTTSNASVATVSVGQVKGIGKGTAIIKARTADGGYEDTCTVTVLPYMVTTPYSPEKTDLLTHSRTGISASTYTSWSNKTFDSGIKYAGKHLGTNGTFKFDSSQNAGIVSTTSGNIVTKVSVVWSDSSADGSDISVYGSESAYSSATSVYNAGQGTLLGHIIKGTSDELIIEGPYVGIGIRPKTGVVEIDSVTFNWEKKAVAEDTVAINEFVNTYMHLDYTESSGDYDADARKCVSENWYNTAKVAFNAGLGLTNDQKAILMTSTSKCVKVSDVVWTYKDVRDRLEAWARNNHDVFDEYTWTFSSKNNTAKNNNQTAYIIVSISLISVSAVACIVLFLKRKRYN